MDMGSAVLEQRADEPIVPEQEDSRLAVLRHKVDTLVSLGRRSFIPSALGRQDSEPVDLGQEGFGPAAVGLDLEPAPVRVDLVGMYTRVVVALFDFLLQGLTLRLQNLSLGLQRLALRGYGLRGVRAYCTYCYVACCNYCKD